ncbi:MULTISPECIES: phage antirepressor KilAC domain-containing protein [Bacillus cereus group]|uniref:DNA-binding protein n=1 Tax=Bacillus thuringiensis subsp. higo TaxID=132266 RepID=A0A9X6QJU1_BACUH|nr:MULTISPECIES: phage antirepressor [Bacillus cereus group]KAA0787808.1 DNA-binding protein [Bacillus sp. BB56-3]OUB41444.1 DNA-binding protein [Bacillus thuringiensis serovar higo]OUB61220.1 DNA-binding protein [Bacillus thuringiensis serovar higo]
MNQLQVFNNEELGQVRTVVKGEDVWFVGKDVCEVLQIKNTTQAMQKLDPEERTMFNIGRQGETNIINESGLYSLIMTSRKPQAKAFKKWVTSEVLPSIRKHGAYMTPNTINALLQDPDLIIGLASQLKQEQQARQVAEQKNLMLTQQIAENASKITYLDQILQSQDTVTVSQVAADYGLSAMRLNKILKEEKIQYKVNDQWLLYSKHQNKGYTKSKTVDVTHSDGSRSVKMNTRWTQKGRIFIHEILTKQGIIPEMDKEVI